MRLTGRARPVVLLSSAAAALGGAIGGYAGWLRRHLQAERQTAPEGRNHRTQQLLQITDAALGALPLDELLVELLRRVCDGLPGDAAALLLTDSPLDTPVLRAAYGFEPLGEAGTMLPGLGLAAEVREQRRAVALVDAEVANVRLTALHHMGAVAGAPLLVDSRVIGVLEIGRREPIALDEEALELLQLAADRTAMAVEHARVFERERHIAQTLQRSLLPTRLPEIPGVELETRFMPAGVGQEIGGDFYDAIPLTNDRWLLVIGDVCGKGPEAAALTSMVRYTLRGHAPHESRPGELLGLLNDAMLTQRSDALFCTAVCILLETIGDRQMVAVAGGGHPMPLILRADGEVEPPPDPGGPLIGVWTDAEFHERRYRLFPGDMLVAYTDGLLEAHAPERILTPDDLAALAFGWATKPLPSLLRALESAALGSSIEPVRDDIAILALAIEPARRRNEITPPGTVPQTKPRRRRTNPEAEEGPDILASVAAGGLGRASWRGPAAQPP